MRSLFCKERVGCRMELLEVLRYCQPRVAMAYSFVVAMGVAAVSMS